MFREFVKDFNSVLYIQIWKDRIKATNIKTGKIYNEPALLAIERTPEGKNIVSGVGSSIKNNDHPNIKIINPFSHPRVLINDFPIAEKMLQHIVYILLSKRWMSAAPKIIIHPMEKYEGGITLLEYQALIEIALGAGAKEAAVYTGAEIPATRLNFDKIKEESVKKLPFYAGLKAKKESYLPLTSILTIAAIVVGSVLWFTSLQQ